MLTKTKKWLAVIVMAIAAFVLVACGGENKVPEPVNPTAIKITFDFYEIENGVLINGEDVLLNVEVTPANGIKTVEWKSSDTSIATVSDKGEVKGLKPGKVKITAVSTVDATIKDEIELTVYESKDQLVVLANAKKDIDAKWKLYITEDTQLPSPNNPFVKVEYYDVYGDKLTNNVYRYNYVKDEIETLTVKLTYMDSKIDFFKEIRIVQDAVNNEFTAAENARAQLAELLKVYDSNKVMEDIVLPNEYTIGEGDDARTVVVSYTSSETNVLKIVDNNDKAIYSRPNDDTPVTLEAYFVCGNVGITLTKKVVANGYSKEEKLNYIKESVINLTNELRGKNVILPTADSKFHTTITWATTDATVLTATGKMNPLLDVQKDVKLTATIKYAGTLDATFAFEETVEYDIKVYPCENDAESAALMFSNSIDDSETFPFYFPWGLDKREGGNVISLPNKVGVEPYQDVAVTWSCNEEGLFSATWELQKQYLRYHEATLTYTVKIDDNEATGEVVINVGIAKVQNTIYIGGRISAREGAQAQPYDELHTFSPDDEPVGIVNNTKHPDPQYKGWSGYTFYVDITDEDGKVTRYQYFSDINYASEIIEGPNGVTFAEDGSMTGTIKTMKGALNGNYQYLVWYNKTDHDVKLPLAYLNYKGSTVTHDINGQPNARETCMGFTAWGYGFAADANGIVTFGTGDVMIETKLIELAEKDAEGNYTLQEYVTIPAHGFGWSSFTSQRLASLGAIFAVEGRQLVLEQYQPKY